MKLDILSIILWPQDSAKEPRVIRFQPGCVNLVTGASRSGKSALIEIVDYCLGSGQCDIPKVGPIRKSCSWYGLLVATDEGQKLLARRDPGPQDSTDDYYLAEGLDLVIPNVPTKNSNRSAVRGILGRLGRIPQASADFLDTGSGFKGRASFGDMTAFVFQPQTIVASNRTLFFGANEEEHARKLREIFPLVLGAVDAEMLVKQHRLWEVRRLLERKKRQLDAAKMVIDDYAGQVRGRFLTAVELGLAEGTPTAIGDLPVNILWGRLHDIANGWREKPDNLGTQVTTPGRLAVIKQKMSATQSEISSLKIRLTQLRELSMARHTSEENATRKRDRLSSVSWLSKRLSSNQECPICGGTNHAALEEVSRLTETTRQVEALWQGIQLVPPMLDAEEVEVRKALTKLEEELRQLDAERSQIEAHTTQERDTRERRAHFVGRLQEFLEMQQALSEDGELSKEIELLELEEQALLEAVDPALIAQRKEAALFRVSRFAQHYGSLMRLETGDDLIQLDTSRLTIRVIGEDGSVAWLREIGSGQNWLGYHVSTLLALHELFVTQGLPYVPRLLMLDQPSQTQFPDDTDEDSEHEEFQAVRMAFEAFSSAITRTHGALQIIVSDHAGGNTVAGISNVHIVERWRQGRKLVPWHWHQSALAELIESRSTKANGALQDLIEPVLLPKLNEHFDLPPGAELESVEIEEAKFIAEGLAFTVLAELPSFGERTIHGKIALDLSVEIQTADDLSI